jgi:hypothetical protein
MRATRGIRQSLRAPLLFAAAAGLALSASGCIIDSSSGGCSPDLTIPWRIVSNLDGSVLTCAQANADTVTAWIDGGGLGSALTPFSQVCAAGSSQGQIVALLPTSGTYDVSVELTLGGANGTLLSETGVVPFPVDCSGLSSTPRVDLLVNF